MPPSTTRSGNPSKRAAAAAKQQEQYDPTSKYAPTSWGNGGSGGVEELTVPSGQMCLCRRAGVEGLIKAGVLKNIDSLSAIVNEKHLKRVNGEIQLDMKSLDEAAFDTITDTVDKIVCFAVVQPPIKRVPDDVTLREPRVIYADMVDLVDKMFIFNFVVGGTRDLESFRNQFNELLGDVESGSRLPGEAE